VAVAVADLYYPCNSQTHAVSPDLDLCLVLDENIASQSEESDERTPRQILEQLGKLIRKEIPYLYCQYKTHARIPIIKLYARRQISSGLYGSRWNNFIADISVGNLLAIWNTRLLKAYAKIDDRFRYLVLVRESIFITFYTAKQRSPATRKRRVRN
jgi:DNA polymerase sigma